MARPTDYSDELLKKAQTYLTNRPSDEVIPSIEGLADFLEITRTTIYLWESQEDKAEFSYIVEAIRHKQAKELVNKGLKGDFNPTMAKVMLTKHGYSDKQEIDHTTKGEKIEAPSERILELAELLKKAQNGTLPISSGE